MLTTRCLAAYSALFTIVLCVRARVLRMCVVCVVLAVSDNLPEKLLSYNRANRAVAILCNHQRAPPKSFEQSMANLQSKVRVKREQPPHPGQCCVHTLHTNYYCRPSFNNTHLYICTRRLFMFKYTTVYLHTWV